MNYQQAFNDAYLGMQAQGWKASVVVKREVSHCRYRGQDGTKCAIGHMIPDEDYNPLMEGKGVNSRYGWRKYFRPALAKRYGEGKIDVMFFADLQCLHDQNESTPVCMKEGFELFAAHHGLTIPA